MSMCGNGEGARGNLGDTNYDVKLAPSAKQKKYWKEAV